LNTEEDEIDLRELFGALQRHKLSIFFTMTLVTILSIVFSYFQPNIYSTASVVEIGKDDKGAGGFGGQDFISMAMSSSSITPDAEIRMIKSRYLTRLALAKVDFQHRYYTTIRFKEYELYKESPFDVNLTNGYNISFTIYPYNKTRYRVESKGKDEKTKEEWEYTKLHNYGEAVHNKYFDFILNKKDGKELEEESYRFVVLDEEKAIESARKGVSTSMGKSGSTIIDITYEDCVPLRAYEFNNALSEAYISQSVYRKTREASKTLSFIESQLKNINNNLNNSAAKLENFKKETSTVTLDSKASAIMAHLSEAETRLATINIESGLLNTLYDQVKTGKNLETITLSGLAGSSQNDSGMQALTKMVTDLQNAIMKLRILRTDYTEQYPAVVKLRRQIIQMKKNIISMIKNAKNNFDAHKSYQKMRGYFLDFNVNLLLMRKFTHIY